MRMYGWAVSCSVPLVCRRCMPLVIVWPSKCPWHILYHCFTHTCPYDAPRSSRPPPYQQLLREQFRECRCLCLDGSTMNPRLIRKCGKRFERIRVRKG
ncbi:hypothetical protein DL96DRAFT_236614 [Flagelloscypha sp. PMI_526]|nr:hypothetical protein DL96DRAFT_236614 [Flagelloscypha sp. PMI_526]